MTDSLIYIDSLQILNNGQWSQQACSPPRDPVYQIVFNIPD